MDQKDLQIISLNMKIDELERDKATLIEHMRHIEDLSLKAFARDAECCFCQRRHAEIEEEYSCFY